MALVTFGTTARAHNAVAFANTTNTNLSPGFMHGGTFAPHATRSFTFAYFDEVMQSVNERNNNLYTVNSNGVSPYLNDVSELAGLLVSGKLVAYASTYNTTTGVFTTGSALASASTADGSVTFS